MKLKTKNKPGGLIPFLVTVISFGVLVPWWKGLETYDPLLLIVSLLVPLVFVTPIATDDGGQLTPVSRASRAFLYSALMSLLIAFHMIVMVNVTHWFGHLLLPPAGVLFSACLAAVVAEACLAVFVVWLQAQTSAARTVLVVRVLFGAVMLGCIYLSRFASPAVRSRIEEHMTSDLITQALLEFAGLAALMTAGFGFLIRRNTRRV